MGVKKEFKFDISYFKGYGSNKLYTSATFKAKVHENEAGDPFMPDVKAMVRGWRDHGGQGSLPGLQGEGWSGVILVSHKDTYPVILLPDVPEYEEILEIFRKVTISKLPGLLAALARISYEREVWQPGGASRVVRRMEEEITRGESSG